MKGLLQIITNDPFLGQKLRRELAEHFDHIEITDAVTEHADTYIYDCRLGAPIPSGNAYFYITEEADPSLPKERQLPLPLPLGLAGEVLKEDKALPPLLLLKENRAIRFYNEHIRLTEVEFALLSALIDANGSFLSRKALRAAVWGEEGTDGLLSVYIHYLREKLEHDGEKVILSSRKEGYALAKKFTKGEAIC